MSRDERMTHRRPANLLGGLVLATMLIAASSTTQGPPADFRFVDASPSIDHLASRLLDALARKDAEALTRLRVNKHEYLTYVMPGSAPEGDPPQRFPEKESEFFWGLLNTKSVMAGRELLETFGGHTYALKRIEYRKPTKKYAWLVGHRDPVLILEAENGSEGRLLIGSIAEVAGQYKFVAFNSD